MLFKVGDETEIRHVIRRFRITDHALQRLDQTRKDFSLLPEGVAESLLRTCESTIQVAQALFPSGQGVGADLGIQPEPRVGDAVAANAAAAPT
jgi:hypothetical protein